MSRDGTERDGAERDGGEAKTPLLDKRGLLAALAAGSDAVLEFGCGPRKQVAGSIGIDARDLPGVDVVGDVFDVLAAIPDASVALIHSAHFLEHVEPLELFLREAARVLRPGGRILAIVPHFSSPYFYSDPTHRIHFGLYTFSYYVRDELYVRDIPHYGEALPLRLVRVHLNFSSPKSFPARRVLKRPIGWLVNLGRYTQELYEENFCYWFPCYTIEFELERER